MNAVIPPAAARRRGFGFSLNALGPLEQEAQPRAAQSQTAASAPTIPAIVTISEIVPNRRTMPALISSVRVAAIGRKKAR